MDEKQWFLLDTNSNKFIVKNNTNINILSFFFYYQGPLFSIASPTTPRLSLPPGTPGSATPPVFKSVQLQGVEMLARILGMPSEAVGTAPNYNFTISKLELKLYSIRGHNFKKLLSRNFCSAQLHCTEYQ